MPGPNADGARATAALLDRRHRDLLDGLPLTVTLDVDGLGPTLFCHATPRRDDEFVLVDSPVAVWRRALDRVRRAHRRDGSHAHAVRPARRRSARGQPGQRRHVVRRRGRVLGAARPDRSTASHHVRRGGGRRADHCEQPIRMPRRGRRSTSSRHRATPRRSRSSASWWTRFSPALRCLGIPCGQRASGRGLCLTLSLDLAHAFSGRGRVGRGDGAPGRRRPDRPGRGGVAGPDRPPAAGRGVPGGPDPRLGAGRGDGRRPAADSVGGGGRGDRGDRAGRRRRPARSRCRVATLAPDRLVPDPAGRGPRAPAAGGVACVGGR